MIQIKKISSLFLAIVFLLSSFGFTINKMICLESGNVEISLTDIDDCCSGMESANAVLKTKCCCNFSSTTFQLFEFYSSQKNKIPDSVGAVLSMNKSLFPTIICSIPVSELCFIDLPLPIYGRKLLSFISILII